MNPENKKITIIIYIAMLIIAIGGVSIAIYEKDHDLFGDDYIEIEHDDDDYEVDYDDEYDYDYDEDYEPEPEPEKPSTNNMDQYLEQIDFVVTKEAMIDLINSSNCIDCSSTAIQGEMFKDEISNNYKLLFTANRLWKYLEYNHEQIDNYQSLYGNVTISEKVLLENAKKIFKDVEIPSTFDESLFYKGTTSLTCKEGQCTFNQSSYGLIGPSPFLGYETKIEEAGNNLTVQQIYIEDEYIRHDEENDTYIFNINLYDTKDGNLIKTIYNYEIDISENIDAFAEFSKYYNQINTYVYRFDENNALLEVERVD